MNIMVMIMHFCHVDDREYVSEGPALVPRYLDAQTVSGRILIFASAVNSSTHPSSLGLAPSPQLLGILPASSFFLDCVYSLLLGKSIIQVLKP